MNFWLLVFRNLIFNFQINCFLIHHLIFWLFIFLFFLFEKPLISFTFPFLVIVFFFLPSVFFFFNFSQLTRVKTCTRKIMSGKGVESSSTKRKKSHEVKKVPHLTYQLWMCHSKKSDTRQSTNNTRSVILESNTKTSQHSERQNKNKNQRFLLFFAIKGFTNSNLMI